MINERIGVLLSLGTEVFSREVVMGDFFRAVDQMEIDRVELAEGRPSECVLSVGPTGNLVTSVFVFKSGSYG